jgi:hypothetical protein
MDTLLKNWKLNLLLLLIVFVSKESILVNEELVLILAFGIYFVIVYKSLRLIISQSLDEEINQIFSSFVNHVQNKRTNLIINRELLVGFFSLLTDVLDLINYSEYKLKELDIFLNNSFEITLDYMAKVHLYWFIQEELDMLYLAYFRGIFYLFDELSYIINEGISDDPINDIYVENVANLNFSEINTNFISVFSNSFLNQFNKEDINFFKNLYYIFQFSLNETNNLVFLNYLFLYLELETVLGE